jgi:hypothetical protein
VKGSNDGIPEIETSRPVARKGGGGLWAVTHYVRVCVYGCWKIKGALSEHASLVGCNPPVSILSK